jgi:hypothetical protein
MKWADAPAVAREHRRAFGVSISSARPWGAALVHRYYALGITAEPLSGAAVMARFGLLPWRGNSRRDGVVIWPTHSCCRGDLRVHFRN